MTTITIKPEDMPAPDTLVDYGEGGVMAAMFHYADSEADLTAIAIENGFDFETEQFDVEDVQHPLHAALAAGESICDRWRPEPPEGFTLGGVYDTEDGPVALYLQPVTDEDVDDSMEAAE